MFLVSDTDIEAMANPHVFPGMIASQWYHNLFSSSSRSADKICHVNTHVLTLNVRFVAF